MKAHEFLTLPGIFRILRNPLLFRLLGTRANLWLLDKSHKDWDTTVQMILGELATSRSPRYSKRLLLTLTSAPPEVLEANALAKRYFAHTDLGCKTAREAVRACRAALSLCFLA